MFRLNNIKQNVLIVVLASLLTGCGGGGSTDSTTTDSTTIDSTTTLNLKPVTVPADTIDITENSATIDLTEWLNMDYTVTQVKYDYVTNNNYGLSISINDTESTVTLVNLKSSTTYHYQIIGVDNNGKKITNKENLIFTTLAATTQPSVTDTTGTTTDITNTTNNPPEAQNVMIVGTPKEGETLTLEYTFIDADGDAEGDSIIAWSTPTVEVQRGTSKTFTIPAELAGEQLSAWIHPSDGTVVTTNGIQAENGFVTIEAAATNIVTDTTTSTTTDTTSTTPTPDPGVNKSAYEEVVDIPTYDPSNSTHVLITESNGKWNNTVLNDPNKKHFYIEPGIYHSQVALTQSGTANDRRTISLYNGNDTHPASLDVTEIADIRVKFKGGSYWTLDRLSNINDSNLISFQLYNGASHNIINRIHLKNYYYGVLIDNESNFNTVQNSYIDHMSHLGRLNDKVGLAINTQGDNNRVEGTKFINNDIRNAGDGIQLVRDNNALNINYPNTIIDNNRIWADGEIRTNGDYATNGYNINGEYQIAENAMDFKAGSDDVNKPIVITNNMMWGYRTGDTTAGGSFTSKYGPAMVVHYNVSNVIFENNAIFDSDVAMTMSGLMTGLPYSGENWSIRNNIFADIHLVNPKNTATTALYFYNARSIEIENNVFANIPNTFGGRFLSFSDTTIESTFQNNVAIDSQATTTEYNTIVDNNYFYNSKHSLGGENHTYAAAEDANMQEYTFTYKRFTGNPEVKKVQSKVRSTDTSPHSGLL